MNLSFEELHAQAACHPNTFCPTCSRMGTCVDNKNRTTTWEYGCGGAIIYNNGQLARWYAKQLRDCPHSAAALSKTLQAEGPKFPRSCDECGVLLGSEIDAFAHHAFTGH